MNRTWILLGTRNNTRIFEHLFHDDDLVLVDELKHPAAKASEEPGDHEGRSMNRSTGRRYALTKGDSPRRKREKQFAHEVTAMVNRAVGENRFDSLVIVAEPRLLGDLRSGLCDQALSRVRDCIGKDLGKLSGSELATRLRELV